MNLKRTAYYILKKQVFLLTVLVGLVIFVLTFTACNNDNDDCSDNDDGSQISGTIIETTKPDYAMVFDIREKSELSFSFIPVYSGYYVLTYDCENITVAINDIEVMSGFTQYFDSRQKYYIDYNAQNATQNIAHGYLTPVDYNAGIIEVKPYNETIVKYFPSESGLYSFETDGLSITVLDESYQSIKAAGNNVVFLQKNDYSYYYYVVLANETAIKKSIDFSIDKADLEVISLSESNQNANISIDGKAGEVKFYLLDVSFAKKWTLWFAGVNGNKEIECNILDTISFNDGIISSIIVGEENCGYECTLQEGTYFLRLQFKEEKDAQLYFVY